MSLSVTVVQGARRTSRREESNARLASWPFLAADRRPPRTNTRMHVTYPHTSPRGVATPRARALRRLHPCVPAERGCVSLRAGQAGIDLEAEEAGPRRSSDHQEGEQAVVEGFLLLGSSKSPRLLAIGGDSVLTEAWQALRGLRRLCTSRLTLAFSNSASAVEGGDDTSLAVLAFLYAEQRRRQERCWWGDRRGSWSSPLPLRRAPLLLFLLVDLLALFPRLRLASCLRLPYPIDPTRLCQPCRLPATAADRSSVFFSSRPLRFLSPRPPMTTTRSRRTSSTGHRGSGSLTSRTDTSGRGSRLKDSVTAKSSRSMRRRTTARRGGRSSRLGRRLPSSPASTTSSALPSCCRFGGSFGLTLRSPWPGMRLPAPTLSVAIAQINRKRLY